MHDPDMHNLLHLPSSKDDRQYPTPSRSLTLSEVCKLLALSVRVWAGSESWIGSGWVYLVGLWQMKPSLKLVVLVLA